jgi:hypothetical protein
MMEPTIATVPAKPYVVMITYCRDIAHIYGSLLTFKTLRIGFPAAEVVVIDNASVPEARSAIREAAENVGARYVQREAHPSHSDAFIEALLQFPHAPRPLVFLDPDLAFWESVEGWAFPKNTLMAGRLIPRFSCEYGGAITEPRLHTSHLWLPNVPALLQVMRETVMRRFEFDPLAPRMWFERGHWRRHDTTASLYALLESQGRTHAFTEQQLDAYDHLSAGSHLTAVAPHISGADERASLIAAHVAAKAGNLEALRGLWRHQQRFLERRAIEADLLLATANLNDRPPLNAA